MGLILAVVRRRRLVFLPNPNVFCLPLPMVGARPGRTADRNHVRVRRQHVNPAGELASGTIICVTVRVTHLPEGQPVAHRRQQPIPALPANVTATLLVNVKPLQRLGVRKNGAVRQE